MTVSNRSSDHREHSLPYHANDQSDVLVRLLRMLGILRQDVARPVVGPKAYVRLWQRLRSLIVLTGIVVGLGIAVAALTGVIVVGLAFLLESAIS